MAKFNWFTELMGEHEFPDKTHDFTVRWNKGFMNRELIEKKENPDPMQVIIQPQKLDLSKIGGGTAEVKKFEFRPQTWEQFIGQANAKARVPVIIEFFKQGMPSHIALTGLQGHGKTSYIELLAKTMDAHFIQRIGNTVTIETIPDIINEINGSTKPCVFFIDEIDTMATEMIKLLNPVVESFQISGKKINPFIFACATINQDRISEKNPDFLNRLQHKIDFVRYTVEELMKIAEQVHQQLYKDKIITTEQLHTLAENCKYNPRNIINLLRYLVVDGNIDHVLEINEIVKDGLTLTDIKILEYLASSKKALGSNAIAIKCGMRQRRYEIEWEPFLFEFGYLNRTPSRMITDKGREFLNLISVGKE